MRSIEPLELAALGDEAVIVDVREPYEYEGARVEGARLVPLGELTERLAELPADRTFYVMCHSGVRSAQATAFLAERGFDAVDVLGGILGWYHAGLPIVEGAD